jgi:predicted NAD/FAD-binding protein
MTAPRRLAIIGGGIGGVATAWFCDRAWEVSLFETRSKLGGNCHSEKIDDGRGSMVVDLGVQFFHPETHPTYLALLEQLELVDPVKARPAERRFEIPGGLCVLPLDGRAPYFSTRQVLRSPRFALDFVLFSHAARKMALAGDYGVTIASWVEGLRLSRAFKRQILLPWLTASEGHPLEETKRSSARAILQLFAPSHPRIPLKRHTTWSASGGFETPILAMAAQCQTTSVHLRSRVVRLDKTEEGWFVYGADVRSGPFDAVVINAPPWESKRLVEHLPWAGGLVAVLDGFEHLGHRLTIHGDPTYVHQDRRNWALANVGVTHRDDSERSELSIWMGALPAHVHSRQLDVFKSWTTYRDKHPSEVLFERTFQHSIKTPAMIAASRRLRGWQGRDGLWFAGHFTSGIDLQESALRSAMEVGRSLSPASPNLVALERRAAR